ncbi:hypothetical protein [Okeania sp. SIO3I5]|nr:hypothetical protein [Okeania sp. SIO3I5]
MKFFYTDTTRFDIISNPVEYLLYSLYSWGWEVWEGWEGWEVWGD